MNNIQPLFHIAKAFAKLDLFNEEYVEAINASVIFLVQDIFPADSTYITLEPLDLAYWELIADGRRYFG